MISDIKQTLARGGGEGVKLKPRLDRLMDDVFRSESKFDDLDQSLKHRLSGGTDNTTAKRGPSEINRIERRLGWLALTRNSLAEALQHFNVALNAVPDDGYSLWERGMCYDLLSRPELAYSDYAAYLQTRDFRNETDNYRYREVVDFKKYCNKDYFAAEACRGIAGIWPTSLLPLKVYIPSVKGPNSFDPVARAEILKCLDEWCQTLPTVLSYSH